MDSSEIHILDIIGRIIVVDLASGPVDAFDLDDFVVCNGAGGGDYIVRNVLLLRIMLCRSQHTVWMPSILGVIVSFMLLVCICV